MIADITHSSHKIDTALNGSDIYLDNIFVPYGRMVVPYGRILSVYLLHTISFVHLVVSRQFFFLEKYFGKRRNYSY